MEKNQHILVLGGAGQLGTEFTNTNIKNTKITSLARKNVDILSVDSIVTAVENHQPTLLVNCAAFTAVDQAENDKDAAYKINSLGAQNVAIVCHQYDIPLLHISTDYVFSGEFSNNRETDQLNPINIYGHSKLAGEEAIQKIMTRYIILRTSWVFGLYGSNFVKTMLRLGKSQSKLNVVDDQVGGPTSTESIVDCCVRIANQLEDPRVLPRWGVYHFSGYPNTTWYGFAKFIFDEGYKQKIFSDRITVEPVSSDFYKTTAKRPMDSSLNCEKLKANFAIEQCDWKSDLSKKIKHYQI